jgi:hypothetical protein
VFRKIIENSSVAEQLASSQEGISTIELESAIVFGF